MRQGLRPVTYPREITHRALEAGHRFLLGTPGWHFLITGHAVIQDLVLTHFEVTRQVLGPRGKKTNKDWSVKTEGFGVRPGHGFRLILVLAF